MSPARSARRWSAVGHDVRLFTPAYASIDRNACAARPVPNLAKLRLTIGAQAFAFSVLRGKLPGGTPRLPDRLPGAVCPRRSTPRMPMSTCAFSPSRGPRSWRAATCNGRPRICTATTGTPPSRRCFCAPCYEGRPAVRRHTLGADDSQHRLPGSVQRRPRSPIWGSAPTPTCSHQDDLRPAGSIPCATESSTRMRSRRSARPTRRRSAPTSTAWDCRTACARARSALARHSERCRLRGLGSAARPLPAAALRSDSAWRSRRQLKGTPSWHGSAWTPTPRCRSRHRQPARLAEGHRPDVSSRCRRCCAWRAELRGPGQRGCTVREILHRPCAAVSRRGCIFRRATTMSWRTGSRRPATCF